MAAVATELHDPFVIVMKFGGTSVGGAAAVRQVVEVVRSQLDRRPVLVVSAHAGVTDALAATVQAAAAGHGDAEAIAARHLDILRGLGLDEHLLDALLDELRDLVRGVRLVGLASAKVVDAMLSFGERLSARVVAAALRAGGIPADAVDAFDAGLRTDSSFGRARPLPDDGRILRHLKQVEGVPVVTGFLGADEHGNITTLGRNGSDYSAALIGVAIAAEEIQIWKDVDGVHTADPRLVEDALPIRRMSFADVAELASFGSKVLHPAAMVPAMQNGIAIHVRNTLRPAASGTTIVADVAEERPVVHAIAHRTDVALVTVRSHRLVPQHAFLGRVFRQLADLGCDVGPVAVGEAAVTFSVAAAMADQVSARLAGHGEVSQVNGCAVIGVIGDSSRLERGGAGEILTALAEAGIATRCVGLGPLGSTVAFAVDEKHLADTVRMLHRRFFPLA